MTASTKGADVMADQPQPTKGPDSESLDSVSMEEAYLDIPDTENEAILDAKKTTIVTVITTFVFVAVVFIFIL